MKVLQRLIFTFAMVVGLTLAVSAQSDDQKKPPPKEKPPVVTPQPKPPPQPTPTPKSTYAVKIWKNGTGETA